MTDKTYSLIKIAIITTGLVVVAICLTWVDVSNIQARQSKVVCHD